MLAETKALLQGLSKCKDDGRSAIDIEADSLTLVIILQSQLKVTWDISYEIRKMRALLHQFTCTLSHVYTESYRAADLLASCGCRSEKSWVFDRWEDFRICSRGLLSLIV